ncbi:nucleotide sugar dehydrogenase [Halorubrum ezzemoulense]|uniref:nucleotide sugar dehydrogenase n=1 Tax=Halorubrum ezzemoulense TaxID=337243 RepID=UPI0023301A9C|nr:nucleotide sugar dehydrogenase [Halorubrum ezzemoulense]MDB9252926.1 nucleotide sugar dehydrogenase [Halorubrum ezzemoulense]MDB9256690.1 nucleotide sugar dehydrogenase [Halorubrum ezzemoulense]MDB9276997.1 nucleotide sugar dehydrogenase [Halorubrum ezzemoulense]
MNESTDIAPVDKIVVMGTGSIGLPLALLLAKHEKRVIGVDIDENLVDAINDASLNLNEDELQRLLEDETTKAHLEAQTEPTVADAFVISVPTPLGNPQKSPNLAHLEAAIDAIIPYLERGNLINIESTIPPLTCEEVIAPRLREAGLNPGKDIQLAHSPERILPGNVFEEIRHNDRIIGGIDDDSRRRAAKLYKPFLEGEVYYTDLTSAELSKLMENTFRDINVAIANEFALVGDELGVNAQEVIDLANKHPRVDILDPGIGVGGHCLPVDPWFLNEADPEHTNLITTARRINDKMPEVATRKIRRILSEYTDPEILALGFAYKPNTYDTRNSPSLEIIEELQLDGYDITAYDRYVDGSDYEDLRELLFATDPDVVLQLVAHDTTVTQLEECSDIRDERDITMIQFTGHERFSPRVDE